MKSLHGSTSLLEDLILSEKNTAFSNMVGRLTLLNAQYDNYFRGGGTTREDMLKCNKDLLNEMWESMFLEQKLREKYKDVQ